MDDFENLDEDEKLKAENDFLKMKMMLERGAQFNETGEGEILPPGIENQFLQNIMEFEKQFDQRKTVTVFDKIGSPAQFKPVNEIPGSEIENAWEELSAYMSDHGVELSACSPKVTSRELYRFATEELFQHETDDINIPGMMNGFIYDEFHPDYEYENTNAATDDCIKLILRKELVEYMPNLARTNLRLNKHTGLTEDAFKEIINRFKDAFDDIETIEIKAGSCVIHETLCTVKGTYAATGKIDNDILEWNHNWQVRFHFDDDFGFWNITDVQIEGIDF